MRWILLALAVLLVLPVGVKGDVQNKTWLPKWQSWNIGELVYGLENKVIKPQPDRRSATMPIRVVIDMKRGRGYWHRGGGMPLPGMFKITERPNKKQIGMREALGTLLALHNYQAVFDPPKQSEVHSIPILRLSFQVTYDVGSTIRPATAKLVSQMRAELTNTQGGKIWEKKTSLRDARTNLEEKEVKKNPRLFYQELGGRLLSYTVSSQIRILVQDQDFAQQLKRL